VLWLEGLRASEAGAGGGGVAGPVASAPNETGRAGQPACPETACAPAPPSLLYVATDLDSWDTSFPAPDQDSTPENSNRFPKS
jgi:hypothetical protein